MTPMSESPINRFDVSKEALTAFCLTLIARTLYYVNDKQADPVVVFQNILHGLIGNRPFDKNFHMQSEQVFESVVRWSGDRMLSATLESNRDS